MSERVLFDEPDVAEWVAARVDVAGWMGPFHSIGFYRDGKLAGAAVYDGFTPYECCLHLAIESPPVPVWVIRAVFAYPFGQLKLKRVTGLIRADNEAAMAIARRNGFVEEGRKRRAMGSQDEVIMGLLASEAGFT